MKSASRITRRLLCGVLLALCAATALPQTATLYTVEIIVFRNSESIGALPDSYVLPAVTDDGIDATLVPTGKLNAAGAKLRGKNSGIKVLAHAAWTQGPTAGNSHQGVSAEQVKLGEMLLGKVFLERGRASLLLGMDLTVDEAGHRFRINQMRTVKPNQIYYFDQPALGAIAIVTPVTGG